VSVFAAVFFSPSGSGWFFFYSIGCGCCAWVSFSLVFRGFFSSFYWFLFSFSTLNASVRVEGKFLEVVGGGGGPFPFKIAESSRRKRFFIRLSFQEFCWLAVQMVRFCFSKGEPLWVRTFRWGNRCLLLQLRKNGNDRFIVFSLLGDGGQSRTVIFPEGAKANGWFGVSKILKEILIEGHKRSSPPSMAARPRSRLSVGRTKYFANAVKGQLGGSLDSQLMRWRCRACGSWDVSAAVIGEGQHGGCNEQDRRVPSKDGFVEDVMFVRMSILLVLINSKC